MTHGQNGGFEAHKKESRESNILPPIKWRVMDLKMIFVKNLEQAIDNAQFTPSSFQTNSGVYCRKYHEFSES
jgi:hypothetical protein